MLLSTILKNILTVPSSFDCEITGINLDSRLVKNGDLFIAYRGERDDGHKYIATTITQGAKAVLCENEVVADEIRKKHPQVVILATEKLLEKIGLIAANFYQQPSTKMTMIGITGTNGKTSCSHFIAQALYNYGKKCGIIGTVGFGFPDALTATTHTTPDAITLQKILADLAQADAKYTSMEVSSHSLSQYRTKGINFKIAVFTNLTQDHLDYHHDMTTYGAAKKMLFNETLEYAIINNDDEFGRQLIKTMPKNVKTYAYSINGTECGSCPLVRASNIKLNLHGLSAKVTTPWGEGILESQLLGRFNVSNLLAVLTVLAILGIPLNKIFEFLKKLSAVPGRMQTFGGNKKPLIIVDYAHTPDALEKALATLREHCRGKIWCVFGCGGDRDRGKRPIMGKIAEHLSDYIIITSDNPRHEEPQKIAEEILSGMLCPWAAEVEHDRHAAIAHAIDCAEADDMVLIAGKGHEEYQIIGDNKIPFSDIKQVKGSMKNEQ